MTITNPNLTSLNDLPDGTEVVFDSIESDTPIVLTGKTDVRIRGRSFYFGGNLDAVQIFGCTRCSLELSGELVGESSRRGILISPDAGASIRNTVSVALIRGFQTGIFIGSPKGMISPCDENRIIDTHVEGGEVGILIDGPNAQLQQIIRPRINGCTRACIEVARGGCDIYGGSLLYSPVGVLVGEPVPQVNLHNVWAECGAGDDMFYVKADGPSGGPGNLNIVGGASACSALYNGTRCGILWRRNGPLTLTGHQLGAAGFPSTVWAESGYVTGTVNVFDPEPAGGWFRSHGEGQPWAAKWDVGGGAFDQAGFKWRTFEKRT